MSIGRSILMPFAHTGTRFIAARWGASFPFHLICEYPKSGGTWLGKMVADVLQLPYPTGSRLPIAMRAVIHNHWPYDARFRNVFYLARDGRDVMVSLYFFRLRRLASGGGPNEAKYAKIYDRLLGPGYDANDTQRNLPRFIEHEFTRPGGGTKLNWAQHILSWRRDDRPDIAFLTYEQLLSDCAGALSRALAHVTHAQPDPWRIAAAVDKYSMARQTQRKPGEEDRKSFIRKGVAGDWKNHFTADAATLFRDLAGDALVAAGYEPDRDWPGRFQPAPQPAHAHPTQPARRTPEPDPSAASQGAANIR